MRLVTWQLRDRTSSFHPSHPDNVKKNRSPAKFEEKEEIEEL